MQTHVLQTIQDVETDIANLQSLAANLRRDQMAEIFQGDIDRLEAQLAS